ncbi:hypothetical protein KAR91_81465 [Candidatus Pacearchaeota archaeon]|nr:hypothetical protein [Candidatus Pacearchaeota archaeon]
MEKEKEMEKPTAEPEVTSDAEPKEDSLKKKKWLTWAIIAVVVVAALGLAYWAFM